MCSPFHKSKGKGKFHPRTGHVDPEGEQRYSSTISLTSALDGGGWSTPCPGHFTPGKETCYPLCRRLGGPQGWSGWVRKISPPLGFKPQIVQPVASCYTNWAIPVHTHIFITMSSQYPPFVPTYLPNSMQQDPSCEAQGQLVSQEIPCHILNPEVQHNSLFLVPTLSHMHPVRLSHLKWPTNWITNFMEDSPFRKAGSCLASWVIPLI